ncbi:MAG: sugar transferase [Ahrensia sp.]|nr:sugar transferase [Ahrensia sp.]
MTGKLAITGASGQVGRLIVPRLSGRGIELVLLGRDPSRLSQLYPDYPVFDYGDLRRALAGCDAILHLAVTNNDSTASLEEMRIVNVEFLQRVATAARDAGIGKFINATTIHALEAGRTDPYSQTKREGEAALAAMTGIDLVQLRLPPVYGDRFGGRLGLLNRLPPFVRRPASRIVGAFLPIVHAGRVADGVSGIMNGKLAGEVICTDAPEQNAVYRFTRRCLDLAFVLSVVLLLGWLMILVWIAVRLTSPGPGLFAQPRVGRAETVFTCYKFRTMATDAPQAGTHEVAPSHITPLGRFLRKTKIDELPQIWNVARGEMSLVGPRPCLPSQTELVEWRRKLGVFDCAPGITGLAQVGGTDMSEPVKLARIDARYCAVRTIILDARLVLATFFR